MPSGLTENTKKNIAIILEMLRRGGQLHLRGIAKVLSETLGKPVNPNTVSRIIDSYLKYVVDIEKTERYGSTVKLISLKPGKESTTLEDVMRYVEVQHRIKQPKQ